MPRIRARFQQLTVFLPVSDSRFPSALAPGLSGLPVGRIAPSANLALQNWIKFYEAITKPLPVASSLFLIVSASFLWGRHLPRVVTVAAGQR